MLLVSEVRVRIIFMSHTTDQNYQVLSFLGWNAIDITMIEMISSSQKAIKLYTVSTLPDSIYFDLLDNHNDVNGHCGWT